MAALDAADGTTDGKIEVTNLNGSRGYRIEGSDNDGRLGSSVSGAGDINGDGIADFVLGAPRADPSTVTDVGEAYFVFGGTSNLSSLDAANGSTDGTISVSNLNGTTGFKVTGLFASDFLGGSVSHAGDVNGDGIDDVIIGTYKLEGSVRDGATGDQYVLFGSTSIGSSGSIDLSTLDGSNGIVITGVEGQNYYGGLVSAAGDVNGDGFDDLIVGEHQADDSATNAGTSYVIFGGDFSGKVTDIGGTGSDNLIGTSANDYQVGDTGNDILTGGGGVDVQLGGAGNDILGISDTTFRRVDGGSNVSSGADTLRLDGNGMALNLTTMADNKIQGIEKIDATGSGNNTITLKLSDVLNISDTTNTLLIVGDPGDSVVIDGGGTSLTTSTTTVDSVSYTSYTAMGSDMILLVEQEMTKSVI
ncbi:MAG: hypothetical protein QGG75_15095 [Alphaproteobacteria bacterium]|nr:hypothetical protein [Alphaproteobacteria bacterium]